jgi:hypothetical protein
MSGPRVRFVIGGAQKAGTTALARYLARHPSLRLPRGKEAHVFDAPDFEDAGSVADVDARYAPHYDDADVDALHGDATPIYMLHPRLVERIARYNPAMRWIVLLRDPVARAISQYHMERRRGLESWPMLAAFWLERLRLAGHHDNFSDASPHDQVLVLMSDDLRRDPATTVRRVCEFLGVPPLAEAPAPERVFEGGYPAPGLLQRASARLLLAPAIRRLRRRYGIDFTPRRAPAPDRP